MTTTDLTDLTACYWCAEPILHQPGVAVVGLHWNRYPKEIIEPATNSLDGILIPRTQRRFAWGHVSEFGYAHARCAEDAANVGRGGLTRWYEYAWGEPEPVWAPRPTDDEDDDIAGFEAAVAGETGDGSSPVSDDETSHRPMAGIDDDVYHDALVEDIATGRWPTADDDEAS